MKKIVDITLDFETCALTPTAAVMSMGAVAWNRHAADTPFFMSEDGISVDSIFSRHVDLRSEFVEGFAFDQATADWWRCQPQAAKKAVNESDPDAECVSITKAAEELVDFILETKEQAHADNVCLWSQGSDFDLAILRHICYKMFIVLPVDYRQFRDHRTFYLETAAMFYDTFKGEYPHTTEDLYDLVEQYDEEGGSPHEPIYDCKRSIFATWQIMKRMREVKANIKDNA